MLNYLKNKVELVRSFLLFNRGLFFLACFLLTFLYFSSIGAGLNGLINNLIYNPLTFANKFSSQLPLFLSLFLMLFSVIFILFKDGGTQGVLWGTVLIINSFYFFTYSFYSTKNNVGIFLSLIASLLVLNKARWLLLVSILICLFFFQPSLFFTFLVFLFFYVLNNLKKRLSWFSCRGVTVTVFTIVFVLVLSVAYLLSKYDYQTLIINLMAIGLNIKRILSTEPFIINDIRLWSLFDMELLLINIPVFTTLLLMPDFYKDSKSGYYLFIGLVSLAFGLIFGLTIGNPDYLNQVFFVSQVFLIISVSIFASKHSFNLEKGSWYIFITCCFTAIILGRTIGGFYPTSNIFLCKTIPQLSLVARVVYVLFPLVVCFGLVYIDMFNLKKKYIYIYILVMLIWGQSYVLNVSKNYISKQPLVERNKERLSWSYDD